MGGAQLAETGYAQRPLWRRRSAAPPRSPPRPAPPAIRALRATLTASAAMGPYLVSPCDRSATWSASLCLEVTGVKRPSSPCPGLLPWSIHLFSTFHIPGRVPGVEDTKR